MNEQLQSKLVEILSSIQNATKAGADFALEQLPDIAQQYVVYGRASMSVRLALLAALSALASYAVIRMWRYVSRDENDHMQPLLLFPVAGALLIFGVTFEHIAPTLLVWVAPKVWLIKELATLIK